MKEFALAQELQIADGAISTLEFAVDLSRLFTGITLDADSFDLPLDADFLYMGGDEGSLEAAIARNLGEAFVQLNQD